MSNILSQLINTDSKPSNKKSELNVLYIYKYTVTLTELSKKFKKSIINSYKKDLI